MKKKRGVVEDELWTRKEKLNLFVLTNADHLQIRAPPTGDATEQNLGFGLWCWNDSSQAMNVTSKSWAFY